MTPRSASRGSCSASRWSPRSRAPAVAGGLELALWCDLRVAAAGAVFGVFCRRFGVPLVDGGTIRLPRLVGQGRALDMILTGRAVVADEALRIGLADRVVPDGEALGAAVALAHELAALPQTCLRSDRMSVYEQWSLSTADALVNETRRGLAVIAGGETAEGAQRFARGEGRHGAALDLSDGRRCHGRPSEGAGYNQPRTNQSLTHSCCPAGRPEGGDSDRVGGQSPRGRDL